MSNFVEWISNKIEHITRRYRDTCLSDKEAEEISNKLVSQASQYSLNKTKREVKIIVSLTSFTARFEKLHLVIRSVLLQTMKPDEIILYLDDVDEEGSFECNLPDSLKEMQTYGLDIQKRPGAMKPHKKYYYAIKEHPNDMVITIDDDIMYPENLIESLYKTHIAFPQCVVATRAHKMRFKADGSFMPYNSWYWAYPVKNKPRMDLLATGVGGVLYPPYCMDPDLLNIDLIMKLSPIADDLWLKIMQVKKGTCVVVADLNVSRTRADIPGTQTWTLNADNVHQSRNDDYLQRLFKYYGLKKQDFQ